MSRLIIPLSAFFFFLAESTFADLFAGEHFHSSRIFVPHFLFIFILFITIFGSTKYGIIYGLIFGFLFDVVYTEILGVYAFLFAFLALVVSKLMKLVHSNVFVAALLSTVAIALLEILVYEANGLIRDTGMNFTQFAAIRLLPTLILNFAAVIILAFPMKRIIEKANFDAE
ncbi:rod shape-determining protein MreD [Peribacillus deserti]|uniref:Rod shape-determining protein MreD n=1 Tax=Peribacillus deserti TaxID=673318 RepID=A0A2N5M735_9BACI|nr:rod shape-determining protein MreD [Peribacillus deserti]PLT30142.1 rod shape-determining protein MreD [Peribacillus deserti]